MPRASNDKRIVVIVLFTDLLIVMCSVPFNLNRIETGCRSKPPVSETELVLSHVALACLHNGCVRDSRWKVSQRRQLAGSAASLLTGLV